MHHTLQEKATRKDIIYGRTRRIKCDETPGSCRNCTSTGRQCDGYDSYRQLSLSTNREKPNHRRQDPPSAVAGPIAVAVPWASTSDERRCFSFVQARTLPDALSFFDSAVWQQFLLQMVPREPAVWHAVVALGAVHQQVEAGGVIGRAPRFWYWVAVAQSARAFACLRRRNPHDPQVRDVTLLCCLLFTVVSIIWQDYSAALQHLQAGMQILRESEPSSQSPTSRRWVALFRHLDTQIGMDGPGLWRWGEENKVETAIHPTPDPWWPQPQHQPQQQQQGDQWLEPHNDPLYSARQALEPLHNRLFKFVRGCWRMSPAELQAARTTLSAEQLALATQLRPAMQLVQTLHQRDDLTPKSRHGVELLELLVITISLVVQTGPLHHDPEQLRRFTPQYRAVLRRIQRFIADFPRRPTVTVDLGVVPLLFIVGDGCQDFRLRWEAMQALRDWPHQEGPFHSVAVAALLEDRMIRELRASLRRRTAEIRLSQPGGGMLRPDADCGDEHDEEARLEEQLREELAAITAPTEGAGSRSPHTARNQEAHVAWFWRQVRRSNDHWGLAGKVRNLE
ncbi:Zn(II)2Cys6 transcription factor [Aspergillus brunneoviolaceus CBS 621.78]|uniref:Uncharacterized protein n=1 Tax=Aspergillus brunneoviolaceus CBS 621.78 TaxID=1450534 RepID=A0ACD1GDT8_9EURO|nr:hypothetical protein BO95DRAFT_441230 [Aspergillus brunneoviolaceus CBS 621.78]RAH47405.1 hypothetical protein BO95DRAFT_441230 [Aspergillus brunneoviolaceus CBS 621.78]